MDDLRVLQLTRYDRLGGSSRLRFYDYQPALAAQNIRVAQAPFFDDDYLRRLYTGLPASLPNILFYYVRRIGSLLSAYKYDLIWLEKEVLPWLPAWIELSLLKKPYIIDFDDAWFHRYDQHRNPIIRWLLKNKFPKLVRNAAIVIAGSPYLADWAQTNGARKIVRIPTTVDLARYRLAQKQNETFTIGWMGSPSTASYLKKIDGALSQITGTDVHLVGSGAIDLATPHRVSDWREDSEIATLASFDVGIMPLESDLWSEGKCAYKLIQYMAAGLPVVASPVGMNCEVVDHGVTGFLASTDQDWVAALQTLRDNPELRHRMGQAGRRIVEERYSLSGNTAILAQTLREGTRI
jgi:glycosyltransferase involved in cell wall biosynthesis